MDYATFLSEEFFNILYSFFKCPIRPIFRLICVVLIVFVSFGVLLFVCFLNLHINYQDFFMCFHEKLENKPYRFDFIIVGGGVTGSTLAHLLIKHSNSTVLVLEAGYRSHIFANIPIIGPALQRSNMNWNHKTVSQDHACRALKDNISLWPMGKAVGGSGVLNNMIYSKVDIDDFREWFEGDPEFDDEQISSTIEDYLHVTRTPYVTLLGKAILDAAHDLPGEFRDFRLTDLTSRQGARWTNGQAFLSEETDRLKIHLGAHVSRIMFKEDRTAKGVLFQRCGRMHRAFARRGVILSAGPVNSPHLLLLSGIGARAELTKWNIKTVLDLPGVGENLRDHLATATDLVLLNQSLSLSFSSIASPLSAWEYFLHGSGPWTSGGCEVVGYLRTTKLQLMIIPLGVSSDLAGNLPQNFGFRDAIPREYFSRIPPDQTPVTILPVLLKPNSVGRVTLDSDLKPTINPMYLTDERDLQALISGIRAIERLIGSKSMQALGARMNPVPFPGCESLRFASDAYWECYVRQVSLTAYHPVGTARMGPKEDAGSVVGYNFAVHGARNLYVVDSSVLPTPPSSNPVSSLVALAEIARRRILSFIPQTCHASQIFTDVRSKIVY